MEAFIGLLFCFITFFLLFYHLVGIHKELKSIDKTLKHMEQFAITKESERLLRERGY